jgi:hypothetical protein
MSNLLYKDNFDPNNDIGRVFVVNTNGVSSPAGTNLSKIILRDDDIIYKGNPSSNGKMLHFGSTGNNLFVGPDSGGGITSGSNNLGLGTSSLLSNTSGALNIALGTLAGNGNSIGGSPNHKSIDVSGNIYIGNYTGVNTSSTGNTNSVVIGNYSTFSTPNTIVLGSVSGQNTASITQGVITGGVSLNATAQLQIDSTTKGFLPPRLTTAQRDNIVSPAEGLMIYNITTKVLNYFNGTSWVATN